MEKLTDKGKHIVKVGNHVHTNMISKPATVRRGENKCRILEMHLKLKEQQIKTSLFAYRLLYQNFMATANQKSTIDTHTKQKNGSKQLKLVIKSQEKRTKDERKKKDLQKQIQNN